MAKNNPKGQNNPNSTNNPRPPKPPRGGDHGVPNEADKTSKLPKLSTNPVAGGDS